MAQSYYTASGAFVNGSTANATEVNTEFSAVETGLDGVYDYTVAQLAITNANVSTNADAIEELNTFKGIWSTLTGALSMPATVYHSNAYWVLNTDLADVTAKEPGVDSEWDGFNIQPDIKTYTASVFESASTTEISIAMLTSTKAIVCYEDLGNSNYGTACILDVSGTTITPGTAAVFESATTTNISVTALSSTQAIVTYTDGGNSSYGTACILDISGSTITPGTAAVFESASTSHINVVALSSAQAIVCYSDGGNLNYGTSCILDVSGSTITPGTPAVFESSNTTYEIDVVKTTSTQAIVAYGDNNFYPHACALDVSGSTITPGTPLQVQNDSSRNNQIIMIDSSTLALAYADIGGGGALFITELSLSGSTITTGGEGLAIEHGYANYFAYPTTMDSLVKVDSTTMVLYHYHSSSYNVYASLIKYDSNTGFKKLATHAVTQNIFNVSDFSAAALLQGGIMIMAYDNDADGNSYGMAKIVTVEGY